MIGVHREGSKEEQAEPDEDKRAQHVGHTFSNFLGKQLLLFPVDHDNLHTYVIWVAEPVHDDTKGEPSEPKSANDQAAHHPNSPLQVTPAGLEGSRVHERLAKTKRDTVEVDEGCRVL